VATNVLEKKLIDSVFGAEDGSDMFLRNVGSYKTTGRHNPVYNLHISTDVKTSNLTNSYLQGAKLLL
jgi:hypothetical protein